MQFVSNFRQTFESASFCGPERNVVLSAEREKLIRSPGGFLKVFKKFAQKSSVLRWEAFEELIRSPKKCTADKEPAVSAPVFGAPYQPYFPQSKFPVFWLLAAVGMKFFEKKGLLISPLGYIKPGPLSSHQDIYIYIYMSI